MIAKYSPDQKRLYVMEHLGTQTYEEMAAELDISTDMVHKYLDSIRKGRKSLWSEELTKDVCDQQLNRRGMMVLETWKDYFETKKRREELRAALRDGRLDGKALTDEMKTQVREMLQEVKKEAYFSRIAYDNQERGLTHLLKAVGVYAPDILLQQNNIQVINLDAEKALKDVRDKYGKEMAEQLEERMKQKAIDIKAKEIKDERPTGRGDKSEEKGKPDPKTRAARLGSETFASARQAGDVQGPGPGQPEQASGHPDGGKPSKDRRK
jgi:hypothetical protein